MGDELTLKFAFPKGGLLPSIANLRMRSNTSFKVIFGFWCGREGIDISSIGHYKFIFEGERIQPDDTPSGRGMEDGAQIDVFYEAVGGQ
jgi:small ubiquitin-related modifier